MNYDEKLKMMLDYFILDVKLYRALQLKNEAVKAQDFATALTYREQEVELRKQYWEAGELLLSNEQNVQASVATESDSSNEADKQNQTP